ncbi:MAG TPA: hypothetical protein VII95_04605 [Terriglobales bacterium]|jgi:hypothetical protein
MPDNIEGSEQKDKTQDERFQRHENFESWYANNIQFFSSEYDLKLICGELDWPKGNLVVQQHTALVVSWLQAKIMAYFIGTHVAIHEMTHGKIAVPAPVLPPEPVPPTGELANDPVAIQVYEYIKKAREQFMASLP